MPIVIFININPTPGSATSVGIGKYDSKIKKKIT